MFDERRLYMKQLLRNYKKSFPEPITGFTVKYTTRDCADHHLFIYHNDGIDMAIRYIDELERKVDELQHIEQIIKAAKEN